MSKRQSVGFAYVAVSVGWLASVLYVAVGNIIVRSTVVGGWVAREIDRLPMRLATWVSILCWLLFVLGWVVPLFLGFRRFFGGAQNDARPVGDRS